MLTEFPLIQRINRRGPIEMAVLIWNQVDMKQICPQMIHLPNSVGPNGSSDTAWIPLHWCQLFAALGALWKVEPSLIVFSELDWYWLSLTASIMTLSGGDHSVLDPHSLLLLLPVVLLPLSPCLYFATLITLDAFFMLPSLSFCLPCRPHMVTEYMGIRNESFMKIAAVGTWMGDFVTAWMVSRAFIKRTLNFTPNN